MSWAEVYRSINKKITPPLNEQIDTHVTNLGTKVDTTNTNVTNRYNSLNSTLTTLKTDVTKAVTDARDNVKTAITTAQTALNTAITNTHTDVTNTKNLIGATNNTGGSTTAGTVYAKLNDCISRLETIRTYTVTNNTAANNGVLSAKLAYIIARVETNNTASLTGILSQKLTYIASTLIGATNNTGGSATAGTVMAKLNALFPKAGSSFVSGGTIAVVNTNYGQYVTIPAYSLCNVYNQRNAGTVQCFQLDKPVVTGSTQVNVLISTGSSVFTDAYYIKFR